MHIIIAEYPIRLLSFHTHMNIFNVIEYITFIDIILPHTSHVIEYCQFSFAGFIRFFLRLISSYDAVSFHIIDTYWIIASH